MAHEVVDRHAKDPKKVALFCISREGKEEKYTYRELKKLTSQFANVLKELGVKKGDARQLLDKTLIQTRRIKTNPRPLDDELLACIESGI